MNEWMNERRNEQGLVVWTGKGNHTSPQRVLFVEELSEILTETLPDLWQLGQDYFSGTIMDEVT